MEKSTKELIEEKEEFNAEIDQKIYESVQKDGIKSRAEGAKRRADLQELEDKGWVGKTFTEEPVVIEPEIEVIIEPAETIPEGMPGNIIPPPEPIIDAEKEALKAQLAATKEKLKLLEAAGRMEIPEEVEIVPDTLAVDGTDNTLVYHEDQGTSANEEE